MGSIEVPWATLMDRLALIACEWCRFKSEGVGNTQGFAELIGATQSARCRVFCLRMYSETSTALVSMKARAQNSGTR